MSVRKENATLDILQVAPLLYFIVGLVAILILYWLFGRDEAESNHNRVRSEDKSADGRTPGRDVSPRLGRPYGLENL